MKNLFSICITLWSSLLLCITQAWANEIHAPAGLQNCGLEVPCSIDGRSYHVRTPDGWDGKTPLPVLLHFHGWGRQGKMIMNHSRIAGATRKLGVLLIAPNGQGRTWNMWQDESPDIEFTNSVLEDAAKKWPIDRSRLFVSGYSYGSIMAWRYACAEGERIHSVLAISGAVEDGETSCATAVNFRHVHGTKDGVVGYPYGKDGSVESVVQLWRDRNGCKAETSSQEDWQAVKILPLRRYIWNNCSSGKSVTLDVHQRGHFIPRFWIERQLTELLSPQS